MADAETGASDAMPASIRVLMSFGALPFILSGLAALYRLGLHRIVGVDNVPGVTYFGLDFVRVAIAAAVIFFLITNRWRSTLLAMAAAYLTFWLGLFPGYGYSLEGWAHSEMSHYDQIIRGIPAAAALLVIGLTLRGRLRFASWLVAIPPFVVSSYFLLLMVAFKIASKTGVGP